MSVEDIDRLNPATRPARRAEGLNRLSRASPPEVEAAAPKNEENEENDEDRIGVH
jgi:hypothetical protein